MITAGQKAPSFTLPNTKKEPTSLDSLKGKKAVVLFYPGAFTGVCEKELCTIRDSMGELNAADAGVLAISVDSPFANGAFAAKMGVAFPLLSDVHRTATKDYGVAWENFAGITGFTVANRAVFVLDREGMVRWAWAAPNPGVEPDYAEIKKQLSAIQ